MSHQTTTYTEKCIMHLAHHKLCAFYKHKNTFGWTFPSGVKYKAFSSTAVSEHSVQSKLDSPVMAEPLYNYIIFHLLLLLCFAHGGNLVPHFSKAPN